jgi:hypothetical protein
LIGNVCPSSFSKGVTVTDAEAVLVESAFETAMIENVWGVRIGAGPVYKPYETEPGKPLSPGKSVTDHVMEVLVVPTTFATYS